jgi:hypothetical protein
MKRNCTFGLVLLLLFSVISVCDDYVFIAHPVHYDIRAELVSAEHRLQVSAVITLKSTIDSPSEIVLGLHNELSASAVFDADGKALEFREEKDEDYSYQIIAYPAGKTLKAGDEFKLRINYGGVVEKMVSNVNMINEEYTELGQALMWYPRDLDYEASEMTFSCDITAPADQVLFMPPALAALKEKREEGGNIRWIFEPTGKKDWTAILVASNKLKTYASTVKGISGEIYYVRSTEEQISHVFNNVISILDTYNKLYGKYDEKPHFSYFLTAREGWSYVRGGTAFMPEGHMVKALKEDGMLSDSMYSYLAHELAHLWWGKAVKPEKEEEHPNTDWFSEGGAEFSSMVAAEEVFGADAARKLRQYWHKFIITRESGPSITKATKKVCEDWNHWRDLTYYKAAFVFYMLREEMGAARFYAMMRDLVAAYNGKSITTSQFFEHASKYYEGFGSFADQWLLSVEIPSVAVEYEVKEVDNRFEVRGMARQDGTLGVFPLALLLRGEEDSKVLTVSSDTTEEPFSLMLDFKPVELVVDPDCTTLLKSTVVEKDKLE